jgi:hypothetical protein
MNGTTRISRRLHAPLVGALVLVLGASFSVAQAARRAAVPYSDRCTVAAPDTDQDRLPDCLGRRTTPPVDDSGSDLE